MEQKTIIKIINITQNILLGTSVIMLMVLPTAIAYYNEKLPPDLTGKLFSLSILSATLVMSIRPLANLLPKIRILGPLVILRKGIGAFSASIIVSIMLSKIILFGWDYIAQFATLQYWSLTNYAFLARIGDITAVLLLATSNNYAKRVLGKNWKRIQRTAYLYFYAGGLYELLVIHDPFAPFALTIVTVLVIAAYIKNRQKRNSSQNKNVTRSPTQQPSNTSPKISLLPKNLTSLNVNQNM
ncbi:MAG: hypothetical protein KC736_03780 [Candidatus Moranbacteria bacterium]|nr:hypothetical protein [Candidatus Moranbacteria bacterium]